jgi:repressor LexA
MDPAREAGYKERFRPRAPGQGNRDGPRAPPHRGHRDAGASRSDHVLTWRQRKVLQVIRESVQRRAIPFHARIGEAVGLTARPVSYQLSTLQNKGYLGETRAAPARWRSGRRATRPSGPRPGARGTRADIPSQEAAYVLWSAASPQARRCWPRRQLRTSSRPQADRRRWHPVPAKVAIKRRGHRGWRLWKQEDAENGEIVAAMIKEGIEGEATVKTLRFDGHIWLMPHNPAYDPTPVMTEIPAGSPCSAGDRPSEHDRCTLPGPSALTTCDQAETGGQRGAGPHARPLAQRAPSGWDDSGAHEAGTAPEAGTITAGPRRLGRQWYPVRRGRC